MEITDYSTEITLFKTAQNNFNRELVSKFPVVRECLIVINNI